MYIFLLLSEKYIADIITICNTNLYRQTVPALKITKLEIINKNNKIISQKKFLEFS